MISPHLHPHHPHVTCPAPPHPHPTPPHPQFLRMVSAARTSTSSFQSSQDLLTFSAAALFQAFDSRPPNPLAAFFTSLDSATTTELSVGVIRGVMFDQGSEEGCWRGVIWDVGMAQLYLLP